MNTSGFLIKLLFKNIYLYAANILLVVCWINQEGKKKKTRSGRKMKVLISFSRPRDFYHCCYGLSGLSIAQHVNSSLSGSLAVVGSSQNELVKSKHNVKCIPSNAIILLFYKQVITHPIYNISITAVVNAMQYFNVLPKVS